MRAFVLLLFWCEGLAAAQAAAQSVSLEQLETAVVRAEDVRAIKKLQRAYGYYADRGLWDDLADLFTDDATANYPSGGFDGNASIRAMFVQNLGQGKTGLAEGRVYNHTILQPVVDLAPEGATATGRWRVLGMLGRYGGTATWADSLYRFDYVKRDGRWKIHALTAYAGSGGGYEQGWIRPKPRPPGAVDTSPVRFNLAHPADRPWIDPCEADVSVCVVPFPYANRGTRVPAPLATVSIATERGSPAADLVQRAQRLADEQAVTNLQHAYEYDLSRGRWRDAAARFAPDGAREEGQAGVYVGRERIRRALALAGPEGLADGQRNDHLAFEPIVDVAADGRSAKGRFFELAFTGGGGRPLRLIQNVHENEYVRRGDRWWIRSMHVYTLLVSDYAQGWAKSALPLPSPSSELPPDRAPSVVYEPHPKTFLPPLHFTNPASASNVVATQGDVDARRIAQALKQAERAGDYDEIENLQNAFGYYAEKALWSEIAPLFVKRPTLGSGQPEGPAPGMLNSQLQLQPVIDIAADGRTASLQSRLLRLARDANGRPVWGGGRYVAKLASTGGVWRFVRLELEDGYEFDYRAGWSVSAAGPPN
ncbi:MAG: nuclear transport factor 2 family protein [Steroidobacteraceae bacterium]